METENKGRFMFRLRGNFTNTEIQAIGNAYRLAKNLHRGQSRQTGERYFEHVRAVAIMIMDELQIFDAEMIIIALLHDCPEDQFISDQEIERLFGSGVAQRVALLNKFTVSVDGMRLVKTKKDNYFEQLATADWKTRVVKCCDRIHNLRTLDLHHCGIEKIDRVQKESRERYLDLARATSDLLGKMMIRAIAEIDPRHPKHYDNPIHY